MSEEKINYSDFALDPAKDVLVSPTILLELQKFVDLVKVKHTEYKFPQQTTWYNRETHQPIDNSKKISEEELQEKYYQNINLVTTEKKGNVVFDELSLSAIKLQAAFEEIFRYNVDQGNKVDRPKPQTQTTQNVVEGPTLAEDES